MIDPSLLTGKDVCIGFFDGIHLGHRKLLEKARVPKLCLTFSMDLAREKKASTILTACERNDLLSAMGFSVEVLMYSEIVSWSDRQFLSWVQNARPKRILVGEDFRFGKNCEGRAKDFLMLSPSIETTIVPLLLLDGEKVSSSRIRSLLQSGALAKANALLEYPFFVTGVVLRGLGNGRKIGFPTANIAPEEGKVQLPSGVYQTTTQIDGRTYDSMTNIGTHPTIEPTRKSLIETHVLDFHGDLYGKEIRVFFHRFLRPQRKFHSLDELKEQLESDRRRILQGY